MMDHQNPKAQFQSFGSRRKKCKVLLFLSEIQFFQAADFQREL